MLHFYRRLRLDDLKMILVEGGPTLLPGLPPKMGEYARRILRRRGIEVLLGDGVTAADAVGITLAERTAHRDRDDRLERRGSAVVDDCESSTCPKRNAAPS